MGVLACNRNGCDKIMCDHYSAEHGYLCDECLSELKGKVGELTIAEFMESPKGEDKRNELASEESIAEAFRLYDD